MIRCAPSLTRIKRWAWSSQSRYPVPSLLPSRRVNSAPFDSHPLGGGGGRCTCMRTPALWFLAPYHSEESKDAKDGYGALIRGILHPLSSPEDASIQRSFTPIRWAAAGGAAHKPPALWFLSVSLNCTLGLHLYPSTPLPFAMGETTDELPDVLCSTALRLRMARPGRAAPPATRRI